MEGQIKRRKTGLVVEGGGMKCAYSAGILDGFLDGKIAFDYCIGVSAGAGNLASYLAGQRGRNLRFFTEHIHESGYFGLRSLLKTGSLFGLRYIYGELIRADGRDPLDFPALARNPAEYYVAVTDARTARPRYFSKGDMKQDDYRCVMASNAIPAVCRPVEIDGVPYFDGGLTDAIPVDKALADGCNRLVVLLSKPRDFVRTPQKHRFLYTLLCRKYPATVAAIARWHDTYNENLRRVYALEKEGRAFVFAPAQLEHVNTYSMDASAEQLLYDEGLRECEARLAALTDFLA